MEKEDIGTKATRADIIKTLYDRGYFYGNHIFATDIALTINEVMSQYSPKIISVDMTRKIEENLEKIESNQMDDGIVIHQAVDQMIDSLAAIKKAEKEIGSKIGQAVITTIHKQNRISSCPLCNKGTLNIIRSKKTHKRFIGCSRYIKGCRASAPLPQRGTVTITSKTCSNCGWPIIYLRFYRKSWRQCVNSTCKSKRKVTKDEM